MLKRGDGMSHISFDKLADYVDGRIDEATADQIALHLESGCESCLADLQWLEHTLSLMSTDRWVAPPANLNSAVIRAFKEQTRPADTVENSSSLADRVRAFLTPRPQLIWGAVAVMVLIAFVFALQIDGGRTVEQQATAGASQGVVMVQAPESDEWQPVEEDQRIKAGDTVKTGSDSTMVLTYNDQSITIIEPNSELTVVEMSAADNGSKQVTILDQSSGRTRHQVNKLNVDGSLFEVRTPSAVVTVVGTVFSVDVDSDGNTGVEVEEGVVSVTGDSHMVRVAAGESTTVLVAGEPEPPTRTLAEPSPTTEPLNVGDTALATATDLPEDQPPELDEADPSVTPSATPRDPTETSTAAASPPPPATPTPTRTASMTPGATDTSVPTVAPPQPTKPPPTSTPKPPDPTATPDSGTPTPPYPGDTTPESTMVPPGQTKTPQPPGQTKTPKPNQKGDIKTPQP